MTAMELDEPSFHDNFIHGLSYIDEDFQNNLVLDIDHIKEWHCETSPCTFLLCPSHLVFKDVSHMKISIQKKQRTLESYLGVILDIHVSILEGDRKVYRIEMAGEDYIEVQAECFELCSWGEPITSTEQRLPLRLRIEPT